jgi:hypothetical protein
MPHVNCAGRRGGIVGAVNCTAERALRQSGSADLAMCRAPVEAERAARLLPDDPPQSEMHVSKRA